MRPSEPWCLGEPLRALRSEDVLDVGSLAARWPPAPRRSPWRLYFSPPVPWHAPFLVREDVGWVVPEGRCWAWLCWSSVVRITPVVEPLSRPLPLPPAAFSDLDADGSGKIDTGEVKNGLEKVGMVSHELGSTGNRRPWVVPW